ncbi:MAG: hypothetical protein ABIJ39_06725 [Chloroflexota bacterium]
MKTKTIHTVLLVTFILASCAPATKVVPTVTVTSLPTLTIASQHPTDTPIQPLPTPTELQLPFDDSNVDHLYCQSPDVFLSFSEAQGLSDDEIAGKLMGLWLAYFNVPQAPGYCRVDGYRIDNVYYDERTPALPLEPIGDIMRVVQFSIKLIQIPNFWMCWPGEIDQQNWLHTGNNVAVFRSNDGYTMTFAFP